MSKRSKVMVLGTAGLLLVALPALAKPKPAPIETAVIENTGSTNFMGYVISLSPQGSVQAANTPGYGIVSDLDKSKPATLPKSQIKKLFDDLAAAMPLTSLPVRHGMRSASFGTSTYITYKGQKSPDLTFAADPRTLALKADIEAITRTLHVGAMPRHPFVQPLNSPNH